MNAENYRIISLLLAFLHDDLSDEERNELMRWVELNDENKAFFQRICHGEGLEDRLGLYKELNVDEAYQSFAARVSKPRVHLRNVLLYAAVVVCLFSVGTVWLLMSGRMSDEVNNVELVSSLTDSKAYLTLEDGKVVALETMDSVRVLPNGAQISDSGRILTYSKKTAGFNQKTYNCLTTSRGGEYRIILEDGTRVFLNACSELKFPENFDADKREITFSGEAYFEVAKETNRPFFVNVNGIRICVLGTSFNVNTYNQGEVETVLVEGKIDVEDNLHKAHRVKPGQLARFSSSGEYISLEDVDVEPYIAWIHGVYIFQNETLERLMFKLSMWYDVDIQFEDESLKKHCFTGRMEKSEDLEAILRSLQYIMGIQLTKEGNTIIISK